MEVVTVFSIVMASQTRINVVCREEIILQEGGEVILIKDSDSLKKIIMIWHG